MANNALTPLLELAKARGLSERKLEVEFHFLSFYSLRRQVKQNGQVIQYVLKYAGSDQRQEDLFSNENVFSRTKSAFKGIKVCVISC